MTVDLFIKTWSGDFPWLYYCLASIRKFATNYNKVIIIVPEHEKQKFADQKYVLPERTEVFYVKEEGHGYLFQMYIKMQAHKYSSADYIKYLDSDCILNKPFDAHSLIYDGKPEVLMTKYYDEDGNNKLGHGICWKFPTEETLRQPVDYEFMRRHIICYHRQTLIDFEEWFIHDLKEWVAFRNFDRSFSEFNVLGAFAYIHQNNMYKFVDTDKDWVYADQQVNQYFSHGGIQGWEAELESVLRDKKVLIMVLSYDAPPYGKMIETSKSTWDSVKVEGVETMYYVGNTGVEDSDNVIHFPVPESLYTMGHKDIAAYTWALNNKDFDYVARVNSSCYVDKKRLFDWVQSLPKKGVFDGVKAPHEHAGEYLWGGAQYLMSRDVMQAMIDNRDKWRHEFMEDVAMSVLARDLGFQFGLGNACSVNKRENDWLILCYGGDESYEIKDFSELRKYKNQYFYRVKNDSDRGIDEMVMNELYKQLK
jgi:hypothetical protein